MTVKQFLCAIVTAGPIGYLKAPGTCASFIAFLFIYFFSGLMTAWYTVFCLFFMIFSGFILRKALPYFSKKDPSEIVLDEIAGCFVACIGLTSNIKYMALAFLFFRFFDITKWFGIHLVENFPGAAGVLFDDIAAGLLALSSVHLLRFLGLFA